MKSHIWGQSCVVALWLKISSKGSDFCGQPSGTPKGSDFCAEPRQNSVGFGFLRTAPTTVRRVRTFAFELNRKAKVSDFCNSSSALGLTRRCCKIILCESPGLLLEGHNKAVLRLRVSAHGALSASCHTAVFWCAGWTLGGQNAPQSNSSRNPGFY